MMTLRKGNVLETSGYVMSKIRNFFSLCLVVLLLLSVGTTNSSAQGKRGFNWSIQPNANSLELNNDQGHWVMEVTFKPMRFVRVNITDPQTGKKKEKLVWYLLYKAVNRPIAEKKNSKDIKPFNTEDKPHSKPYFVPDFVIVRNDNDGSDVYNDQILPQAEKLILKRELRGEDAGLDFKNPVDIVRTIPDAVEKGKEKPSDIIYGIVTWTDISPKTDNFTLYMTGFSSGYKKIAGPGGRTMTARRTIMQKFWRPGDKFDEEEIEFRRLEYEKIKKPGETETKKVNLPRWIYRPDPGTKN